MAVREYVLGRLRRELWHARDVHADVYAAELQAQIDQMSAGSPDNPARETTSRRPAANRRK